MTLGVTVASRYAEALMLRAKNRKLSLVVVEGPSDSRVYRRVLRSGDSHILWLNGKGDALELVGRFRDTRIVGSVGIIDADLDRLNGKKKQSPEIVWTSETDMETMVLRSNAYFRVFPLNTNVDHASRGRSLILAISAQLGAIRALSQRNLWSIDFKRLEFETFVDRVKLTSDFGAICEEIRRKNPQSSLDEQRLLEEGIDFLGALSDESLVYHGHDLCRILGLCGVRIFGSKTINFEKIAAEYTLEDFSSTSTYQDLKGWEMANEGFLVLP